MQLRTQWSILPSHSVSHYSHSYLLMLYQAIVGQGQRYINSIPCCLDLVKSYCGCYDDGSVFCFSVQLRPKAKQNFADKLFLTPHETKWDQEKSSSGKKFELPKKSNFFPLELFSSNFFLVHMEAEVLQQWQTTHFKACSK